MITQGPALEQLTEEEIKTLRLAVAERVNETRGVAYFNEAKGWLAEEFGILLGENQSLGRNWGEVKKNIMGWVQESPLTARDYIEQYRQRHQTTAQ